MTFGEIDYYTQQTRELTTAAWELRRDRDDLRGKLSCALDKIESQQRELAGVRRLSERSPTHLPPPPAAHHSYTPTGTSPSRRAPFDFEDHNRWLAGVAARTGYQPPERYRPPPPSHTPRLPAPTHCAGVSLGRGPDLRTNPSPLPTRERPADLPHRAGYSSAELSVAPVWESKSEDPTLRRDVEEQGRTLRRLTEEAAALRALVLAGGREPQPADRPERDTPPEVHTPARRSRNPTRRDPPQEERPLTLSQLLTTRGSISKRISELESHGPPRGRRAREELGSAYNVLDTMIAERQPRSTPRRKPRAAPERTSLNGNDVSARGCYACTHNLAMKWMTDPTTRSAAQRRLRRSPH